ncbi:MAG: prepilin-type N-terminal cleavage/methylation domain-containing protein [Phycisphaerales bacterium]
MTKLLRRRSRRSAFSLVELVLACALLAILLAAGRGAIGLAQSAARSRTVDQSVSLSGSLNDLTGDIACATHVIGVTSTSIGVVVPDRNGDGEDETIEYSWSGTAGAPLLRVVNSGTPETIVSRLQSFSIVSSQQTITVPDVGTKNTERLVGGNSTSSGLKTTVITASNFRAGSFVPANLPATATSWNLTRVRVMVRQYSPVVGSFAVQVQTTNGQVPTGVVLGEVSIAESDLSTSFGWKDVAFTNISNLSKINPLAVIVKRLSPAIEPCELQATNSGGAMVAGNMYFSSSTSGASWTTVPAEDMIYAVYGIPNSPAPTTTGTGVSSVRITAESSSGVSMQVNIPLSNIPQM